MTETEIERACAMKRIEDKLWELEGYRLACELHRATAMVPHT